MAPAPNETRARTRVVVLLTPHVHLLDLAGPVQVLHEANAFGGRYDLLYAGEGRQVSSAQGLGLGRLRALPAPSPGDLVLIPGMDSRDLDDPAPAPLAWLRAAHAAGARLASICSGAFILARAGLLDGRRCTTHWKLTARLQRERPRAIVERDRLFITDGGVTTSAGVASGIDMALAIVEEDLGPIAASRVAREIVVYVRRDASSRQMSVYLDYRTHLHPGVHRVQDWLVAHPEEKATMRDLGRLAGMSERHLARVFKEATGITLGAFRARSRFEMAERLFHDPALGVEAVADRCGYRDARQLRRLWRKETGTTPSRWRRDECGRSAS